jgi:hypothetical protein
MKNISSRRSKNSAVDEGELFQRMFPDSEIAKQFSLGKDKMSYFINFRLAPYFKTKLQHLIEDLCGLHGYF